MSTTNVTTKIGQFQQPGASASFAAVSANAFYLNGVSITGGGGSGGGGVGSITGGANTGSGVGLFSSTSNANINIKSLSAGPNIGITDLTSMIEIGELSGMDINFVGISGTTVTVVGQTITINASGTATGGGSSTGGLVPYTGATANVNLAAFSLIARSLSAWGMTSNNNSYAAPVSANLQSLGDRLVIWDDGVNKYAIGVEGGYEWFQAGGGFKFYGGPVGGAPQLFVKIDSAGNIVATASISAITLSSGTASVAQIVFGDGSTLTSAPVAGGVTQIVAGQNVTISPAGGTGIVTVNSSISGALQDPTLIYLGF